LEHAGLSYTRDPISEDMAFGLAGGLGFGFAEMQPLKPPFLMLGRTGSLEQDFCDNLELEYELFQTDDENEGWQILRDRLDTQRPTMIWTDMKDLDYLRVRMHNTRMHNTHHTVIAVVYDDGSVLLADNDREELQRCSRDSLARARNSQAFPYGPNRHGTWLIEFRDALPPPELTVPRAVSRAVRNMSEDGDGRLGLAGVDALRASYPSWPHAFGPRLAEAIKGLVIFIAKAGTGGAMFRSLHAGFLRESAGLTGDPALVEAAAVYDELTGAWRKLADLAREGEDDPVATHAAGLGLVDRIAELEHAGVEAMRKTASAS
jgi:hypothetical protein